MQLPPFTCSSSPASSQSPASAAALIPSFPEISDLEAKPRPASIAHNTFTSRCSPTSSRSSSLVLPALAPSVYRRAQRADLAHRGCSGSLPDQQAPTSQQARRARELRNRQVGLELHQEAARMQGRGEQRDFEELTM
uniref:Uncharacterized protein n=1 Tax=Hanusia phi TaxID=3032 RepID=A0A7S0EZK7_9CRYP